MIINVRTNNNIWIALLSVPICIMLYAKKINKENLNKDEKDKN